MKLPTKTQIKAVLKFLEYFENPEEKFYEVETAGSLIDPYYYSDKVEAFIQALYKNKFITPFDWGSWQKEAWEYIEDDSLLAEADLETITKLFTSHIRKNHFYSCNLAEMIDNGHILKLLKRLGEIADGP